MSLSTCHSRQKIHFKKWLQSISFFKLKSNFLKIITLNEKRNIKKHIEIFENKKLL